MAVRRSITLLCCVAFCATLSSAQIVLNAAYTTTAPTFGCGSGSQSSTFLTTDLNAWLYVSVSSSAIGDVLEVDYLRPDGTLYTTIGSNPLTRAGDQCFDPGLPISGTIAMNYLGTWTIRGYWNGLTLFTTTFTLSPPPNPGGGGPPTGVNLLKNPGGEQTAGDPNCGAASFIISWSIDSPGASLCQYGNFEIHPGDPGPSDRGANYFTGGPANSFSELSQHLDVSSYASLIDGGFFQYVFSGWLGGFDSVDDSVTATATFRDASTNMTGYARIGPVLAADRNNITGLIQKSANGMVPRATRIVDVVLQFTNVAGTGYNHAAADSMSLVFGQPGGGGGPNCIYNVNPLSNSVGASGGSETVLVTTTAGCTWTASTTTSWITIVSGASGSGNGSVNYQVAVNASTNLRTGTITIAGQTHTVTQAPGCAYTLSSASANAPAAGASGLVLVFSASFCAWTATSNASWITVAPSAGGTGFGGVKYTVAANSGGARSGTLTAAGQTFAVSQAAAPGLTPAIAPGGIVNAASYLPANVSSGATSLGGAIAQGSFFSIFGSNLGPAQSQSQASYPLQTLWGGVSVTVSQGNTSVNAYPVFVSAGQINAIMPSNAPLGDVQVAVINNGVTETPVSITISSANFGIFTTAAGKGPGIIQNYVSATQLPLNTRSAPAMPGQTEILLGTGLGGIGAPDNLTPPVGSLAGRFSVTVGGKTAPVLYSGRLPGAAGVDQINFQVPTDAPSGCYVPVQVQAGSGYSNIATMAISAGGGPCSDPQNPLSSVTASGGKTGSVLLARADVIAPLQPGQPSVPLTIDLGAATFADTTGTASLGNMFLAAPPVGTCSALSGGLDLASLLGAGAGSPLGTLGRNLDAGPSIGVSAGLALKPLDATVQSSPYAGILGGPAPAGLTDLPSLLDPGTIQISGSGGKDVGAFKASAAMGTGVAWSNRSQISPIDRSTPLTIKWSGGDASKLVLIAGSSTDLTMNTSVGFVCFAPSAPGSFTVPVSALANLPATLGIANTAGMLMVATIPGGSYPTFQASGLDAGFIFTMNLAESAVDIK